MIQNSETEKIVYLVHAVDTEGPISETLDDTFERIKDLFGVTLEPTRDNLEKLQRQELDLGGQEAEVASCVAPKRIEFFADLRRIDQMLDQLFNPGFRRQFQDDFGNPYRLSWYCLDHVGFIENPRRRLLGFNAILKHYLHRIKNSDDFGDTVEWHYHGVPFNKKANCFALNWSFSNAHIEILSRRLIDFAMFPLSFRPGGWIERPDMSYFLEQWIPLDFGNHATAATSSQPDYKDGRFADWRRAPQTWIGYHPDFHDYQIPGEMKRTIFRSLSLHARYGAISAEDIRAAFSEAKTGKAPVLSVTNHDNRDMVEEISTFWSMLKEVQAEFPGVKVLHAEERLAARACLKLETLEPLKLTPKLTGNTLTVESNHAIWGPQPFLAFKTVDGRYLHDNLASDGSQVWHYTFDDQTVPLRALEAFGLAAHDDFLNTAAIRRSLADL